MKLISRELQSLVSQNSMTTNVNMNVGGGTTGYAYGRGYNAGSMQNQQGITQKQLLIAYLKRRSISIIITVAVIIILLTSSIFTDFGFNIGDYILSWFK